ncbi:MAG: ribbon-helix-helix domain-containing protein [Methyloligella sp. ZOD6]
MTSSKRSITIAKHRTSVSVEDEFWEALAEIAEKNGTSIAKLVEQIDEKRGEKNLSSAIRSFVLKASRGA